MGWVLGVNAAKFCGRGGGGRAWAVRGGDARRVGENGGAVGGVGWGRAGAGGGGRGREVRVGGRGADRGGALESGPGGGFWPGWALLPCRRSHGWIGQTATRQNTPPTKHTRELQPHHPHARHKQQPTTTPALTAKPNRQNHNPPQTQDFKIRYASIIRLFLLPKPATRHTLVVISLDPPIRKGQTFYNHLLCQVGLFLSSACGLSCMVFSSSIRDL